MESCFQTPRLSRTTTTCNSVIERRARYNYTGEEFFVKKKDRGFRHVTSTAKLIIREALPIQCVEAVFVGAYLTADMVQVKRAVKQRYVRPDSGRVFFGSPFWQGRKHIVSPRHTRPSKRRHKIACLLWPF